VNRLIAVILLSLIPLSGCSSPEPELSYDPVELIEYERCINTKPQFVSETVWLIDGYAESWCKNKKPVLK